MNKILIVSDHLSKGGVASVCRNLAIGLLRRGYTVSFLSAFLEDCDIELPEAVDFSVISSNVWDRRLVFPLVIKLVKFLNSHDFDIIISNKDHVNFYIIIANLMCKKPAFLVCNSHNTVSEIYRSVASFHYRLMLIACRFLYRKPNVVANVSFESCLDSESFFGIDNVRYLPNPVFDELPIETSNNPFPNVGSVNILACGRLVYQKNYSLMLHAFAEVAKVRSNIYLTVLGDGSKINELKILSAKLGIESLVTFEGNVNNVGDYMQFANCLWITSHYEGFGMVIVEALSHGCPVISVDCPHGPKEILEGGYGKIVESYNVIDNANALLSFLKQDRKDKRFYQERALDFSISRSTEYYIKTFR